MKKYIFVFFKLFVSSIIIYILVSKIGFQNFYTQLQELSLSWTGVSIVMILTALYFATLRLNRILRTILTDPKAQQTQISKGFSIKSLYKLSIIGFSFNQVLPGLVGGDAFKAYAFNQSGLPLSSTAICLLLDRLYGILALSFFSLLGFVIYFDVIVIKPFENIIFLSGLILLVSTLGLFLFAYLPDSIFNYKFLKFLLPFKRAVVLTTHYPFFKIISSSILVHLSLILCFQCLAYDLNIDIPFTVLFSIIPSAFLLSALPISFAGWGLREGAMVFGLSSFGIDQESALVLSFSYGIIQLLVAIPGFLLWFSYKNASVSEFNLLGKKLALK
ncbi:MAG: flippase-like domain-containing protein [Proteobacteria bacterium]|nr:flippase-like domain-containing protein [Pseudomonadota bacterium]